MKTILTKKTFCLLVLIFLGSHSLFAIWNGERKGFMAGLGFGVGYEYHQDIQFDPVGPDREDNSGIALTASPRIGYALNNQMAIMYGRRPFTYRIETMSGKEKTLVSCSEDLGFYYYLEDSNPSLYFGGGAGLSYFFDSKDNYLSQDTLKGLGIFGTIGFEFIRHLSTELSLYYRAPFDGGSNIGVSLSMHAIGY